MIFFIISTIMDYRPKDTEAVFTLNEKAKPIPDTLSVLSWNIGYAGLGDNMDFFYDGGTMVRDTRERTEENLEMIINTLKKYQCDIMLIQEVDRKSHRTYHIDEVKRLKEEFPDYLVFFAYNYKSWMVPIPIREPIGRVESGLVIMTRFVPTNVRRIQYPSRFPYPVSLFNLKRCLLSASFLTRSGKILSVSNTHNTAFDTGEMRKKEMDFLEGMISSEPDLHLIGGDWNQYPPYYHPGEDEIHNPYFSPVMVNDLIFRRYGRLEADTAVRSLRFNNAPFSPSSITTTTDMFFIPNGISTISIKTIDLKYQNSDHNPILLKIKLEDRL